jgi:hypothetical protein
MWGYSGFLAGRNESFRPPKELEAKGEEIGENREKKILFT